MGYWILSPQWIPLQFFTEYYGKVIMRHIHPLVKGIPPHNRQWQPRYNFLCQQHTYHCCCDQGEIVPRPILSATSTPGISESQTHLLTLNYIVQTWSTRNIVPGRPGTENLWHGKWLSVDWWIGWAFSSLMAASRNSCSNSLLIVLNTVFNTELIFSESRTSSSSSTRISTSLALLSVFFWSSIISFICSNVSWADGIIFRCSWNSSLCLYFTDNSLFEGICIDGVRSIRFYKSELTLIHVLFSYPSSSYPSSLPATSEPSNVSLKCRAVAHV